MKVWITKYALTQGIYHCDVKTFDASLEKKIAKLRKLDFAKMVRD